MFDKRIFYNFSYHGIIYRVIKFQGFEFNVNGNVNTLFLIPIKQRS